MSQTEYKRHFSSIGVSSYYGSQFHNKKTASGEKFNMYDFTAAHPTLAFGTKIKVTNLKNDKFIIVRVNDRGPFVRGRIIDLSFAAAQELGMIQTGTAKVKIELATEDEDKEFEGRWAIAKNMD